MGWLQGRSLKEQWLSDRERWLLWIPVLLGSGAAAYLTAGQEPIPWIGGAVFGVALFASILMRRRDDGFSAVLFGIALFMLGFQLAALRTDQVSGPVLSRETGAVDVIGVIKDLEWRGARARVGLTVEAFEGRHVGPVPAFVRITIAAGSVGQVDVGDRISLKAILRPPGRATHPGGFDFRRWAWFRRLGGTGYAIGRPTLLSAGQQATLGSFLHAMRLTIGERVRAAIPGEAGDIAVAVITGDRGGVSEESLIAMRDSGLAHLLAISGLHLGLVATTIFFLVRMFLALSETLALNYPIKKWAAGAALVGSFAYLLISGGTVPTQRAFIMTGLVLLAVMADRQAISMRLVAVAATVVLLVHPESVIGPGFQMSFAAVIALVAFYEAFGQRFRHTFDGVGHAAAPLRYATGVLLTTLIATMATMPFALHHFGRVATLGVFSNLLAVPMMAFLIMPMALMGVVMMPFGLEGPFLAVMGWGLERVLWLAAGISAWDLAHASFPTLSGIGLTAISLGGLWIALWRGKWRVFGVFPILLAVIIFPLQRQPDLLISESGRLVAIRQMEGGYAFNDNRREGFVREDWSVSYGVDNDGAVAQWPGHDGRCDALGCTVSRDGVVVAVTSDPRSLPVDCRRATVLFASFPVSRRNCPGPRRVVDYFALRRGGAHSVVFDAHGPRIDMVDPPGKSRPWAQDPWADLPQAYFPDNPGSWDEE